jgi:hypothetical protein
MGSLDGYLQTAIGIAVSLVLFWLGYRQTIGARDERAAAANADVERLILRRILTGTNWIQRSALDRVFRAKAQDYRVSRDSLMSVDQLIDTLFCRVLENDLVHDEELLNLLTQITHAGFQLPGAPTPRPTTETASIVLNAEAGTERERRISVIVLASVSSIVGVGISLFPVITDRLASVPTDSVLGVLSAVTFTLLATVLAYALYRLRTRPLAAATAFTLAEEAVQFETDVFEIIESLGSVVSDPPSSAVPDWVVRIGDARVLIYTKLMHRPSIQTVVSRLDDCIERGEGDYAVVVTRRDAPKDWMVVRSSRTRVVTIDQLAKTLQGLSEHADNTPNGASD